MKNLIIALFAVIAMSITSLTFAAEPIGVMENTNNDSICENRIETIIDNAIKKHSDNIANDNDTIEIMEAAGEILAIIGVFGMPVIMVIFIVAISMKNNTRRRQIKYDMVNKAIEHGYQLPEYVFLDEEKSNKKKNPMNVIISLISVGLVCIVYGIIKGYTDLAILAIIPLLIGCGQLAVLIFENRKNRKSEKDNNTAENGNAE